MSVSVIGRDRALAATNAFLDDLDPGPGALLIEGDPGIGKTAVWRATLEAAAARGFRVLETVGEQVEARMSFVGLADLVGDPYDEIADELSPPQREALDYALLRRGGYTRAGPDPRTIGTALRSVVVALARVRPVVIAVDDVQWLDAATADALSFAARRLDGHLVGLLVTARTPPALTDRLGLRRAVGDDRCVRLRLGPLSAMALQEIFERRLGYTYRTPVLRDVTEVCDGNPLFALEIARALGPTPALAPGQPLPVPEELHELVAGRVAGLPAPGRRSLLAAAALSHPTIELIERASSPEGLQAAEDAALLRARDGRVEFTHPLYASAIYATTPSGRRQALHGRLAAMVSDREERAHHLALATPRPDEGVAAQLDAAAELARMRGGWSSAGELLEHARALTPDSMAPEANRRGVRAAEHHVHAGDRPRARTLLEEVLAVCPRGSLRGETLRLLADISYNEDSFAEAGRLLDAALADAEDPALVVAINLTISYVRCHHLGDFLGADPHAERAVAAAARLSDSGLLAEAIAVRAMVNFLNGRGVDWAQVHRAVALQDDSRLLALERQPSWIAALLKVFVGRLAEARAEMNVLRAKAERSGDESDVAQVLFWLAWLEAAGGRLTVALSLGEEAVTQASLAGSEQSRAWAFAQLAGVHAQRGDAVAARENAAAATKICAAIGTHLPMLWVGAALGLLELSLGEPAAAWAAVAPLAEVAERDGIHEPFLVFLPSALEALIGLGQPERARRLLESFESRARTLDRAWALALAGRCRGLLLAELGDLEGAQAVLEQAIVEHDRLAMPFELARTLFVQGQIRRRARARRLARESLEQALQLFTEMGAAMWADRARAELDRIAVRRQADELTAAERRTVELAVEGLSNKEIASSLFVTVHTVEVHLSHAYAKLGVRSRAQLARRLSISVSASLKN